jgi:hydroxyacylglutathione hydrolase
VVVDPQRDVSQYLADATREPRAHGLLANLQLIDVRNPGEVEASAIAGAVDIPMSQLPSRIAALDPHVPTVVYCAGGYRSSVAASLVRQHGFGDASDVIGWLRRLARHGTGAVNDASPNPR